MTTNEGLGPEIADGEAIYLPDEITTAEMERIASTGGSFEWLKDEPDELSPVAKRGIEAGEAELARGEFVSLAELRAKYGE